ncbi:MAG: RluA family pseudouridine synthase [Flammeovirgaceae bacterium]
MAKRITFKDLIIFEDEHYVLINKPPFISSLDERDLTRNSIIALAKQEDLDYQLCHRLDKETSGVLAIAKHPDAYRNIAIQFEDREVEKTYHAVVHSTERFIDKLVDLPISQGARGKVRVDMQLGKFAETHFDTLQVYKRHALVACRPITGRMHQIRLHLACIKAPIVMDNAYGGAPIYLSEIKRKMNLKRNTQEEPLMKRVALHAYTLKFSSLDGKVIEATAPYPKDMKALVNQLEKNA